jgi:hypothetical protein
LSPSSGDFESKAVDLAGVGDDSAATETVAEDRARMTTKKRADNFDLPFIIGQISALGRAKLPGNALLHAHVSGMQKHHVF